MLGSSIRRMPRVAVSLSQQIAVVACDHRATSSRLYRGGLLTITSAAGGLEIRRAGDPAVATDLAHGAATPVSEDTQAELDGRVRSRVDVEAIARVDADPIARVDAPADTYASEFHAAIVRSQIKSALVGLGWKPVIAVRRRPGGLWRRITDSQLDHPAGQPASRDSSATSVPARCRSAGTRRLEHARSSDGLREQSLGWPCL
jgi:hypothetical protein